MKPQLLTVLLLLACTVLKAQTFSTDFATKAIFSAGPGADAIVSGDLDGDGKPDLAVVNYNLFSLTGISILRNTSTPGNSGFSARGTLGSGTSPGDIAIGDLNADGKPDLVIANHSQETVTVWRNNSTPGKIGFSARSDIFTGNSPSRIAIGDLDGDGKPELAVTNQGARTISVLPNKSTAGGDISFGSKTDLVTPGGPYALVITDLDGDGKAELVNGNFNTLDISVFRNTSAPGAISFAPRTDFSTGSNVFISIAAGDLDGDGKTDLVSGNYGALPILRNTSTPGNISFAAPEILEKVSFYNEVALSDLDGDGKKDIITSEAGSTSVWYNTSAPGAIKFTFKGHIYNLTSNSLAVTDFDGDGRADIASADNFEARVAISRNIKGLTPSVTLSTTALSSFTAVRNEPSPVQTFTISCRNQPKTIGLSAPAGFQVSDDGGATWTTYITLTTVDGAFTDRTVSVRLNTTALGSFTGQLNVSPPNGTGQAVQKISLSGTVIPPPPLRTDTARLSGFVQGLGAPSTVQTFQVFTNNPGTAVQVAAPAGFEVSLDGSGWAYRVTYTPTRTMDTTVVRVRLNASAAGAYNDTIILSSPPQNSAFKTVSGVAAAPALSVAAAFTPFVKNFGFPNPPPSPVQYFSVSGSHLSGPVTTTAPEGYELSLNGTAWSNVQTFTPSSGVLTSTSIGIRLIAAPAGNYQGAITTASPGAATVLTPVSGTVVIRPGIAGNGTVSPFAQTIGAPSPVQRHYISGSYLQDSLKVSAPAGYEISPDGITWRSALSQAPVNGAAGINLSIRLNAAAPGNYNGQIVFTSPGAMTMVLPVNGRAVNPPPSLVLASGSLALFTQASGNPSAVQNISVSGTWLTGNITVSAPAGYEIKGKDGDWAGTQIIIPVNGTVLPTTLEVRLHAAVSGNYPGKITATSPNAPSTSIPVNGTVIGATEWRAGPNPAEPGVDRVTVFHPVFSNPSAILRVYSLNGREIKTVNIHPGTSSTTLSIPDLPVGTYLIELRGPDVHASYKLIRM